MTSVLARRRRMREWGLALVMLGPSAVVLGGFVLYPLGRSVWLGHQRCDAQAKNCRTTSWGQYYDAFRSEEFQKALLVTAKFVLLTVPVGVVLGIALAVLADKYLRGIGFFRTVFSSTVATSVAVTSLMWLFLLQPSVGVLSNLDFVTKWFPVVKTPGLLRDGGTALGSIAVTSVWANLGLTFIVVTAGMQSIPKELYESAFVDGASGWRRFTNVTLPLLGPTLLFVVVVLVSRAFQAYGEFDILTGGGPNAATTTVTYLTYGGNSSVKGDAGLQSSVVVLLFAILLAVSLVQLRGIEKRVHYG